MGNTPEVEVHPYRDAKKSPAKTDLERIKSILTSMTHLIIFL